MSDQWSVSAPQPDGPWQPQPAPPPYPVGPAGPAQQYPQQPQAPAAPAGPYEQPQSYAGLNWGPAQDSQSSYSGPQYAQSSFGQSSFAQSGYPTPDPYASAPMYTSVPPPPSAYPSEPGYPSGASYPSEPGYPSAPQPEPQPQPQPQQLPYPQPHFPQAPGGPPIAPSAGAASRPGNAFALTGAVTSFIPVLGLVFSIVGLAKAKVLGGAGRGVAVLGVVLSLILLPGWCVAGYFVYQAENAAPADPGCLAAESDYLTSSRALGADATAMSTAKYGTRQFTDAVTMYETDFQALIGKLETDAARAGHSDVQAAISSVVGDLAQLKAVMRDLAVGDFADAGRVGDISALNGRLLSDYEHIQSVCQGRTGG
jgi:hypothetical protein